MEMPADIVAGLDLVGGLHRFGIKMPQIVVLLPLLTTLALVPLITYVIT